ncbi:MAG: thioredoxin family protein [Alphaproteobacteria bacterium]|nr:thioredoxin family protein [Alphaproteobacteria bacterium]MBV9375335.1 thioredoxin family protein [Alphaproteobacteria bacterium]
MSTLPRDGLVAIVKRDCPTCVMAAPVFAELAANGGVTVFTQDDPSFPATVPARIDDSSLEVSHKLQIEIVPTLIRFESGREIGRTYGWDRRDWERLSGIAGLGRDLPEARPGCGAKNVEPGTIERLKIRFNETGLKSRRIAIGDEEDEHEAMFARGWSDGLPLVPPTEERVLRMLDGTSRDPQEVLGLVPPDLAPATVEKIAVNAVMAGCKPEYLPVVLAAVEAVLEEQFAMHGVLATTMFVGPVVVVNGPIRRRIGMNAKGNALGQGNRANAAIGRALQLVIRNIGGGRPQEVDRATLGNPGKYTYCFAEDEEGSSWEPLSVERGIKPGQSAVTVFAGFGLQGIVDQKSRDPESLSRSFAGSLKAIHNVKSAPSCDALLVVCPEHHRTFKNAGWSKSRLYEELYRLCEIPGDELVTGAKGIAEGGPPSLAGKMVNKFRPGGIMIVRAGGDAGMFSGIIGGWSAGGPRSSLPVTKELRN